MKKEIFRKTTSSSSLLCSLLLAFILLLCISVGCQGNTGQRESVTPQQSPTTIASPAETTSGGVATPTPTSSEVPTSLLTPNTIFSKYKAEIVDILRKKQFEEAVKKCNDLMATNLSNAEKYEILMLRAVAYHNLKKTENAKADAIEAAKLRDKEPAPYLFLAVNIYSSGDNEHEGYAALSKAYELNGNKDIEKDPFFAGVGKDKGKLIDFYNMAGRLAHDVGKYEESLKYFNRAIQLEEESKRPVSSWFDRAFTYFKLGRLNEAKSDAEKFLKAEQARLKKETPTFEDYDRISTANMIVGNYKEAFDYLEKTKNAAPKHYSLGTYYLSKGRIYFRMGDYKKAKENFDIVRKKYSADEKILDMPDLRRMEKIVNEKS